jgi:peptidoglycan/LPS O-acetylase OafA/YrhL
MKPEHTFLPEIQGLRALAVGLVVVYHIWPEWLSGGFVGVDVFFVISGYLITGALLREAERTGRISLIDFYGRRVRRLLPAASVVLLSTAALALLVLPAYRWERIALEIAAAALYFENWVLAWLAVDYLASEEAAGPVMHFWSLSIEEQFYFVWPLLMVACIPMARSLGLSLRHTLLAAIAAVFGLSLAASIVITPADPQQAYFLTHTRIWELALGGILALVKLPRPSSFAVKAPMILVGTSAILYSAAAYDASTAFPGHAALLPTVATALLIFAGDLPLRGFSPLGNRPMRYLGDRSYSIYLWHWPLIVFYAFGRDAIGVVDGSILLLATLFVSDLSYRFVETPYRRPVEPGKLKPIGFGFATIAACLGGAGYMYAMVSYTGTAVIGIDDPDYPGPATLAHDIPAPESVEIVPALAVLRRDLPVVYGLGCHQNQEGDAPLYCVLGDSEATRTMAVTGDSHAANWIPALHRYAREEGWRLLTFTKSACPYARVTIRLRDGPYPSCASWRENVLQELEGLGVEVLFTSQSRYGYVETDDMVAGLLDIWRDTQALGVEIIAIADTPWLKQEPGDCLAKDPLRCAEPRDAIAVKVDPLLIAAARMEGAQAVDMTDLLCTPDECRLVVGNVIVWRDRNHLTRTYAEMLSPYLFARVQLPAQRVARAPKRAQGPADSPKALATLEGSYVAQLACGELGRHEPFERRMPVEIAQGRLTVRRGDWKTRDGNFDHWEGVQQGEVIRLEGDYVEGPGGPRPVRFAGRLAGGNIEMKGNRGSRDCTFTIFTSNRVEQL